VCELDGQVEDDEVGSFRGATRTLQVCNLRRRTDNHFLGLSYRDILAVRIRWIENAILALWVTRKHDCYVSYIWTIILTHSAKYSILNVSKDSSRYVDVSRPSSRQIISTVEGIIAKVMNL
jgi:hypothetical protein